MLDTAALPDGSPEYKPHVTLLYLGDMPEADRKRAAEALNGLPVPQEPFEISDTYSVFGRSDDPDRSLVIRLTEPGAAKLKALRDHAMQRLTEADVPFPAPSFPEFLPHVTVDDGAAAAMYRRATTERPEIETVKLAPPTLSTEGVLTPLHNGDASASADLLRFDVHARQVSLFLSSFDYNEDQPRDDHGRFGSGGGSSTKEDAPSSKLTVEAVRAWPKISGPLGSQGGTWHKDPTTGKEYLLKPTTTVNRASNEIAAGAVYRAAGIPFPDTSVIRDGSGKPFILSEKIPDLEQRSGSWWNNHPEAQAKAAEGYGVDALLSHWDVLGLEKDNTLTTSDGTPVRIESGGAMAYRAMGGPKDSFAPGKPWGEPKSMRFGEQGKVLYGNMTDAQAADSLERAQNIDLGKVAQSWKDAGLSTKDTAPWMKTLEERQAQIPAIVARLRGSTDLASRLRMMVFEACHMPAGTPDGGQFVPCDTPGSVDSDGNPAGPDSASADAQAAQKQAEAEGKSKAEAKAIGDKVKAASEKAAATAAPASGHPGAGKLEDLSIKGLKGTPNYSTITHALYHLKHTDSGKPENTQHVGDKSIYEYHGKKYEYMVVTPTGDPKQPNAYEFVPKGGVSALLGDKSVADAIAQKNFDVGFDKFVEDQYNSPVEPNPAPTAPDPAQAAADTAAAVDEATSPEEVAAAAATSALDPDALLNDSAEILAQTVAAGPVEPDLQSNTTETMVGNIMEEWNKDTDTPLNANDHLYQPIAALTGHDWSKGINDTGANFFTTVDGAMNAVEAGVISYEQAGGLVAGTYSLMESQYENLINSAELDTFVSVAAGDFGVDWNSAYDDISTSYDEMLGDGMSQQDAGMGALDEWMSNHGFKFPGTEAAADAVKTAADEQAHAFVPGGLAAKWDDFKEEKNYNIGTPEQKEFWTANGFDMGQATALIGMSQTIGMSNVMEMVESKSFATLSAGNILALANMSNLQLAYLEDIMGKPSGAFSGGNPVAALDAAYKADQGAQAPPPGMDGPMSNAYKEYIDNGGAGWNLDKFLQSQGYSWDEAHAVKNVAVALGTNFKVPEIIAMLDNGIGGVNFTPQDINVLSGVASSDLNDFFGMVGGPSFEAGKYYTDSDKLSILSEAFDVKQPIWDAFQEWIGKGNTVLNGVADFMNEQGYSTDEIEAVEQVGSVMAYSPVISAIQTGELPFISPSDKQQLAENVPVSDLKNYFAMTGNDLDLDPNQYYTPEEKLSAINDMLSNAGDKYAMNAYTQPDTNLQSDSVIAQALSGVGTQYDAMKAITDTFPDLHSDTAAWLASTTQIAPMPGTNAYLEGEVLTKDQLVGLLDGTIAPSDLPLTNMLAHMDGYMIDNLATHLGAEPGEFINALDQETQANGYNSDTKATILNNVLADEVVYKNDAEKFAELPYNDAYNYMESNGIVTGVELDGLSGAAFALGPTSPTQENSKNPNTEIEGKVKAATIFTDKTLAHLNAQDISSLGVSLSATELLGVAHGLGVTSDALKALLNSEPNGANPTSPAAQLYALKEMQAITAGTAPGTIGMTDNPLALSIGSTSSAEDIVAKFDAVQAQPNPGTLGQDITPLGDLLKQAGLVDTKVGGGAVGNDKLTAGNVLTAILNPQNGLGSEKVITALKNGDITNLSPDDLQKLSNLPNAVIIAIAGDALHDVPGGVDWGDPAGKLAALQQYQNGQGGYKPTTAAPAVEPVGKTWLSPTYGIDFNAFTKMGDSDKMTVLDHAGVPPHVAQYVTEAVSDGVKAENMIEALKTGDLGKLSDNDLGNLALFHGTNYLVNMFAALTESNKVAEALTEKIHSLSPGQVSDEAKVAGMKAVIADLKAQAAPEPPAPNLQSMALDFHNASTMGSKEAFLQDQGINKNLAGHIAYLNDVGMDENMLMKTLDDHSFQHWTEAEVSVLVGTLQNNSETGDMLHEVLGIGKDAYVDKAAAIAESQGHAFIEKDDLKAAFKEISDAHPPGQPPAGVQPTNYKVEAANLQGTIDKVTGYHGKGVYADANVHNAIAALGVNDSDASALQAALMLDAHVEDVAQLASNGTVTGINANSTLALANLDPNNLDSMLKGYSQSFTDLVKQAPPNPYPQGSDSGKNWEKVWALDQMAQGKIPLSNGTNLQMNDLQVKIADLQKTDPSLSYADAKQQAEDFLQGPKVPDQGTNATGGKIYGDPSIKVDTSKFANAAPGAVKVYNTSPNYNGTKPALPAYATIQKMIDNAQIEYHSGDGISSYQHQNGVISLKENSDGSFGVRYYPMAKIDPATGKIEEIKPTVPTVAPGTSQASAAVLTGTGMHSYTDFKTAKNEQDEKAAAKAAANAAKYPLPNIQGKGAGEMPVAAKHLGFTSKGAGTTPGYISTDPVGGQTGYYAIGKQDKIAVGRFEKLRDTIAHASAVQHGNGAPPYSMGWPHKPETITGYTSYQMKDGVFTLYKNNDGKFGIYFEKGAKLTGAVEEIKQKPFADAKKPVWPDSGGVFFGHEVTGQAKDFGNSHGQAQQWGDEKYGANGGPKNYTPTEWAALKSYGDGGYSTINSSLRGIGYSQSSAGLSKAAAIDNAMLRTPTKEPITVYRGFSDGHGTYATQIINAPVGSLFRDKGFMSTSVSSSSAFNGTVTLKIDVPEGVPSVFKPGNQYPHEAELLLPSNTTLEKTGDAYYENGRTVVPVRLVAVKAEPVDIMAAIVAGGGQQTTIVGSIAAALRRRLVA